MDRERFWALVEETRGDDCEEHASRLTARLRALPSDEIVAFQRVYDQLMDESYRWDLWGAAYLVNGGCSDDGFDYFRGWLVGQGRATWEAVLRDPDALAAHPLLQDPDSEAFEDDLSCEDLMGAAFDAYEAVTGEDIYQAATTEAAPSAAGEPPSNKPAGEHWDFDDLDEVRRRYPTLWSRVGDSYEDEDRG